MAFVFAAIIVVPALVLNRFFKTIYLIALFVVAASPTISNLCYILSLFNLAVEELIWADV